MDAICSRSDGAIEAASVDRSTRVAAVIAA
jgi:hypothetical protein